MKRRQRKADSGQRTADSPNGALSGAGYISPASARTFSDLLLAWFEIAGRKDLPWQQKPSPYRVWISEIMLQQTQVATVIPYYGRFMQRFPDIQSLAAAPLDAVLHHWSGLGYYARARNLHKTAGLVVSRYGDAFPDTLDAVQSLPGIGRSTAAAILALSLGARHAILDGNVKRVLTRYAGIEGFPGTRRIELQLWALAEHLLPAKHIAQYTQAIMDLGATVCVRSQPLCTQCPVASGCVARALGWQDRLPAARPGKVRSQKEAHVIIAVRDDGSVLLERRPPSGIWGGLWAFPQFDTEGAAAGWTIQKIADSGQRTGDRGQQIADSGRRTGDRGQGIADSGRRTADGTASFPTAYSLQPTVSLPEFIRWPVYRHSFTHFDLRLHPWIFRTGDCLQLVADGDRYRWYDAREPAQIGLATPVTDLIRAIARINSGQQIADSGRRTVKN